MPFFDDEMEQRRAKREAQRRKQQALAKRTRRTLTVALLAAVLCGVGFWYLTRDQIPAPQAEASVPPTTAAATEPAKTSAALAFEPTTTIHIRAAGDLNITDSVISAGVAINGYDFSGVFRDVSAVLSSADLTVMNFEGNVCGGPYGTATTSAPTRLLEDLRGCGVDMLQMANSCSINNGLNGLSSTLQNMRAAGIEPIGAYATANEFRVSKGYTIVEIRGVKLAFVAFTKGLGGRGMPAGNESLVNLLYTDYDNFYQNVDWNRIDSILKNVQSEQPDITIAMLHWGSEYNDEISRTQKSIVTRMQKRGVDVILGTHSHTVQPIVFDKKKGSLVAYSLGDFFGDATRGGTNYSIILDVEITKDNTSGDTRVTNYSYTPIYTVKDTECPDQKRRVMRIESAMNGYGIYNTDPNITINYTGRYLDSVTTACYESMQTALERIEDRLVMKTTENK